MAYQFLPVAASPALNERRNINLIKKTLTPTGQVPDVFSLPV
jgi:hypothetical protein